VETTTSGTINNETYVQKSEPLTSDAPDKIGFIDIVMQKVISRKFLVFVLATTFLFVSKITSQEWIWVAAIYIGSGAVLELISIMTGAKNSYTVSAKEDS